MIPHEELAGQQIRLRALKESLAITDHRSRADAALRALSWDRPEAQVEWALLPQEIGRFTVGSFPTSASIVATSEPERVAWHAGFRWCVSVAPGAIEWFDLRQRLEWRGTGQALNAYTLAGLTARSFAQTGRLQPRGVHFEPLRVDFSKDPSRRVAEQIKQWWEFSCQKHLSDKATYEEKDHHKDRFTRFVAGVLLLRTIEDMGRVAWLAPGRLRAAVNGKTPAESFGELVGTAANRLNSRVLSRITRDLHVDVKKTIVRGSYDLGVDFAALDVDPVGAFYEEILGVDYAHTARPQRDFFGDDLQTSEDRSARRAQGVYYTPRLYADTLARKLVRPAVRAAEEVEELPAVADIAAGSGELLCAALRELLTEPLWHSPEVAWKVLDTKLYAVDQNPLALQLCALNLLRTAIRYVPELLDIERRFPSLEDNLRTAKDSLHRSTIDSLPQPDVVLINPPFHSPNRWKRPDAACSIPELTEVDAHPNQAVAFFAAAVRLARPGAGLGIIMPSNVFGAPHSAPWRRWLAERVNLDLVVANYGTPFRDVHSYAGLIIGRKRSEDQRWRPRTRIVRIEGNIDPERDTGTLLSEVGESSSVVKLIVPPLDEQSPDWLGRGAPEITANRHWRSLHEVMGDQFHQGVVLAPMPWKADLFLFEKLPNGKLKHCFRDGKVGGPERAKEIVLQAVAARWQEGREFRFAAFTHWDADHIGGLPAVLNAYEPRELIRPNVELGLVSELCSRLDDKDAPRLIEELNNLESRVELLPIAARQQVRDVGSGVEIWALAPARAARARMVDALRGTSTHRILANLKRIRNEVSLDVAVQGLWMRAQPRRGAAAARSD